ncbi:MAG: hypothetical protein ABI056_02045, partial [Caulobacteraceae bacterium]
AMETELATIGEEPHSPISWSAIFAGAVTAVAVSLVFAGLAAGLGYKLAGPSPASGMSPSSFTPMLGAGMVLAQVLAFALGGYLAGRLRVKWVHVHTHEVFFRDTAHGLLAWALAAIFGAMLAASVFAAPADPAIAGAPIPHQADIAAQIAYFSAFGLALGAFVSAVAAALGGMRRDEMHQLHRAGPRTGISG